MYIIIISLKRWAGAFLSSPSADAGLILPSADTQHQRGSPRARVQYAPRARMGNRVWFLNKYCRKPFSTHTRCFRRVLLLRPRTYPTPNPTTIYPSSITNRTTVNPEGYILYTQNALQSCTLRGTCIHIYLYRYKPIYTCTCVLNVVVCVYVCVYYSPSSDASASGYLYVFVRNVCQLCILYFLTKHAPTRVFLTPFLFSFFLPLRASSMCLFVVFYILFCSHALQTRDAYVYIIYIINARPTPSPFLPHTQRPPTHTIHKLFVVIQYNKIQNVK